MVYGSGLDIKNKQSIVTFTQTYVYHLVNLQHFVNHPNVKIKTSRGFFWDIEKLPLREYRDDAKDLCFILNIQIPGQVLS